MTDRILCLDTSIWIAYLVLGEHGERAVDLVRGALEGEARLVSPAFAWAEVGSVLRKKVRTQLLEPADADGLWQFFQQLPIETIETLEIRSRTWEIAHRFSLSTLYDAAFLACTEVAPPRESSTREFWTADQALVRSLGSDRPGYVQLLVI